MSERGPVALVTGIRGQDGAYLAKHLLEKGYQVVGADRRSSAGSWRLAELGIEQDVRIRHVDLLEEENIRTVLGETDPDLIFNLAAQSHVGTSFDQPVFTSEVNAMGVVRLLTVVRQLQLIREMMGKTVRLYQASSSEMFGAVDGPADEQTPFRPRSPYAAAKVHAHLAVGAYREAYGLFGCCGIAFNHESPLRAEDFVTRKIVRGLVRWSTGELDRLELGNLDASRDWGHAADYVRAMVLMLEAEDPADYVLATGVEYTVREFVEAVARRLGHENVEWSGEGEQEVGRIDDREVVRVNPDYYRPADVGRLVGDARRAREALGWEPSRTFEELVDDMVTVELDREGLG